jgi:CheY-like chemotaxis protein
VERVLQFANAVEALNFCEHMIDLIFFDIRMPEITRSSVRQSPEKSSGNHIYHGIP